MSHNKKLLPGTVVHTRSKNPVFFYVCDMAAPKPEQLYVRDTKEAKTKLVYRSTVEPVPLELTIYLMRGPVAPGKRWEFVVHRPGGEVDSRFSWPWDTEITPEGIIETAWDEAEAPDQVESITLSSGLRRLLETKTGA